jgi:hypothetical protein
MIRSIQGINFPLILRERNCDPLVSPPFLPHPPAKPKYRVTMLVAKLSRVYIQYCAKVAWHSKHRVKYRISSGLCTVLCVYVCACTRAHIYMYIYIYTHTHTHICVHRERESEREPTVKVTHHTTSLSANKNRHTATSVFFHCLIDMRRCHLRFEIQVNAPVPIWFTDTIRWGEIK